MTVPAWALGVNPEVHTVPGGRIGAGPPLSWQQVQATAQFLLDSVIGRIAIAFGGIDIFGWKPLEFLADWGQQRVDDALANYQSAMNAQGSANYANSQLSILTGGALASNVTGGVAVSDTFTGASANNFGGSWIRTSDGPGAGHVGPNGSGQGVWKKSGGLWRRHFDRHITQLATDYQAGFVVISQPAEAPSFGSDAYTYLLLRMQDDQTFVYCRIGRSDVQVGKRAGGTWDDWDTVAVTVNVGDQFAFVAGTDADDRQFLVRQNGITRIDHTDSSSSAMGASYRYVGIASQCAERNFLTDQTRPAELDVWSAADRLPEAA